MLRSALPSDVRAADARLDAAAQPDAPALSSESKLASAPLLSVAHPSSLASAAAQPPREDAIASQPVVADTKEGDDENWVLFFASRLAARVRGTSRAC